MNRYQLVIIQKEVALHYYQSEEKLFRLFLDYHKAYDWAQPVLEKQIHYITEDIKRRDWKRYIHEPLKNIGYNSTSMGEGLFYQSLKTESSLKVTNQSIWFHHEGDVKEEWKVFDCLKSLSPCMFAVNIDRNTYGWLKPMKVFSVL
ncbi:sporulation inhibitor of replication protein SirA [Alteribacillus iranensis]|uniref:Sporulation inhibitor of replication protein SirA n=1 Tax=Alteribacillus iranensis TaxID=930128 RepID=A0A1I1ZZQ8_9BACI|nr:sporulation inhibitor of replication protein SirA [Alteribacillus iranensis]SFE37324.1 Protein of unknown function [Alteribacillus iranensis]